MRQGQKRDRARELRRDMTDAERRLWRYLRLRQLDGFRFHRQVPVGPYIADFACLEAGLLVEVDGGQHDGSEGDPVRDAFLRRHGFRILRFWNNEVLTYPEDVCEVILHRLAEGAPTPALPRKRRRGLKASAAPAPSPACGGGPGWGPERREPPDGSV